MSAGGKKIFYMLAELKPLIFISEEKRKREKVLKLAAF